MVAPLITCCSTGLAGVGLVTGTLAFGFSFAFSTFLVTSGTFTGLGRVLLITSGSGLGLAFTGFTFSTIGVGSFLGKGLTSAGFESYSFFALFPWFLV
ncbi:hypothetical protein [Flectobacillus sp. BAB-3569]|uniref:hypothetical protein n=1 Tax=Flectobacillus sp. BAB-3569 TaxID=1509483 RepID=UPI0011402A84|nr:hypothetical protein [Flectobacillus sp. BAB-3569]